MWKEPGLNTIRDILSLKFEEKFSALYFPYGIAYRYIAMIRECALLFQYNNNVHPTEKQGMGNILLSCTCVNR